jgi:hypothetical protein
MRLKAFLKSGCAGLGAGFLILAAYIVVLIHEHQAAIGKLSNYNLAWISGQASVELGRLSQRATAFAAGHIADPEEVQLRFDIIVNRINLLKTGEFKEFVDLDRDRVATVASWSG